MFLVGLLILRLIRGLLTLKCVAFHRSDSRDGDSNAEENLPIPPNGGFTHWHPVLPDPTV